MSGTITVLGSGDDTFVGTLNGDTVHGNAGDDSVAGGFGNDLIYGNEDDDLLVAGVGNDTVFGGPGFDTVAGGNDEDLLFGGTGDDTIQAGSGSDVIVWREGDGNDLILGDRLGTFADDPDPETDPLEPPREGNDLLRLQGWDTAVTSFGNLTLGGVHGDWTVVALDQGGAASATLSNGSDTIRVEHVEAFTGNLAGLDALDDNQPCFVAGTMIATAQGEVPVEALRAGDLVLDMDGGARMQPVIWVGHADVDLRRQRDRRRSAPVRIAAGALADGVPCRDLCVSPDHAVFLNGHLVPAHCLVNGSSIVQELCRDTVRYYHVELAEHGLLVSDGAVTESYLDDGNRHLFDNPGSAAIAVDFAHFRTNGRYAAAACAPIMTEGNPMLARIRAGVEARCAGRPRDRRYVAARG